MINSLLPLLKYETSHPVLFSACYWHFFHSLFFLPTCIWRGCISQAGHQKAVDYAEFKGPHTRYAYFSWTIQLFNVYRGLPTHPRQMMSEGRRIRQVKFQCPIVFTRNRLPPEVESGSGFLSFNHLKRMHARLNQAYMCMGELFEIAVSGMLLEGVRVPWLEVQFLSSSAVLSVKTLVILPIPQEWT